MAELDTPVTISAPDLRVLLRAAAGCATDPERLRRAIEAAEAALPICRAGPIKVQSDVVDGWSAEAVCGLAPGHYGEHVARGSSGGGWKLQWGNEEEGDV
ncbi:MAG: hypothetical protein M1522_06760 [Actinobacteria bacterium]|nr:hypothetical protein [Actinomycetota bacterium]